MKKLFLILLLIIAPLLAQAEDKDDIVNQQKELQKIKKELDDSKKNLDKLKQNEIDVQKQLSESDQKIRTNKTVINRLNKELSQIQGQIDSTESAIRDGQLKFELTQRRYLGNIRQFYTIALREKNVIGEDPNEALVINRRVKYLTAVAKFDSGHIQDAAEYLASTISDKEALSGQKKQVRSLVKKKETSQAIASTQKQKQERSLEQLRRKQTEEADRIMMLTRAAQEMENIIVRLQQELEERMRNTGQTELGPSVFATLKGKLPAPYQGQVTLTYGNHVDQVTNLKSFSSGITIKGTPGGKVSAVSAGTIAYIDKLRGYGNFVIINHDDRFYTTYAGLSEIYVSVNEYVLAGNKIGVADSQGVVKFELRQGRKPLDPIEWIRIDAF